MGIIEGLTDRLTFQLAFPSEIFPCDRIGKVATCLYFIRCLASGYTADIYAVSCGTTSRILSPIMSSSPSYSRNMARFAARRLRSPPIAQMGARHHSSNPLSKPSGPGISTTPDEKTTHFGFKEVPESLKESLVGSVFTSVSPKYDVLNDSMSLGIHRLWKDSFVSSLLPKLPPSMHSPDGNKEWEPSFKCLDVAGGTGDIALRILDRAREKYGNRDVQVEIVDLNEGMLHEGVKRVANTMYYNSKSLHFRMEMWYR